MSAFLVAGTAPDDDEQDPESFRILDCPCGQPFREDRGVRGFCSQQCAAPPAVAYAVTDGYQATLVVMLAAAGYVECPLADPPAFLAAVRALVAEAGGKPITVEVANKKEVAIKDTRLLVESLTRAVRGQERQWIQDALLVRPQPAGVQVCGWEV